VNRPPTTALAWKVRLAGTPVQPVLEQIRWLGKWPHRRRHPELSDLWHETKWIDVALTSLITPTTNCVDIGCHVGSVLALMRRCAPYGTHRAVEASPDKAALLQARYPDVEVHAVAVSDTPGTVTFYDVVDHSGFSGLRQPVADDADNPASDGEIRSYEVPCTTIDDLFADGPRVDVMKIDVEGAELPALRGARELCARDRPAIVFECAEASGLARFGYDRADLHDLLSGYGYDVWLVRDYVFGREPLDRGEFAIGDRYPFAGFNYVARTAGTPAQRLL